MTSLPSPSTNAIPPPSSPAKTLTGSQALSTPTHGSGGSFSIANSTFIAAPPALCLATVLDNASYPHWNRFCRRVKVDYVPEFPANVTPALEHAIQLIPRSGSARAVSPARRRSRDNNANTEDDKDSSDKKGKTEAESHERRASNARYNHTARKASVISLSPPRRGLSAGVRTKFRFEVHVDLDSESFRMQPLEMTYLEEIKRDGRRGFMVAWKTLSGATMPGWMLRSERIQEFLEEPPPAEGTGGDGQTDGRRDGNGEDRKAGTLYRCWETFYGVLAPVARMAVAGELEKGFQAWGEGLKGEAERRFEEMGRDLRG